MMGVLIYNISRVRLANLFGPTVYVDNMISPIAYLAKQNHLWEVGRESQFYGKLFRGISCRYLRTFAKKPRNFVKF